MNRCSKCNNELAEGARFCNICGMPTPVPTDQKRTINPEIKHTLPSKEGRPNTGSLLPGASNMSPPINPYWNKAPDKPTGSAAGNDAPETIRLTPPDTAPDKTTPLPAPNAGPGHAPGIIRPIAPPSSPRPNTPVSPGQQTPPGPMSPFPALPSTPALPIGNGPQSNNASYSNPQPMNTPMPDMMAQDNQRMAEHPRQASIPSRQPVQPPGPNRPQTPFNARVPQTPAPSLYNMSTNYLERQNGNRANGTANRQELPMFSPESFAYTSKAAEHWRSSWRDLQNAEAGPAEDVSKGQASVAAPLANRKDSFIRLRAIRSKQNQDAGERNFGFWVTLFLMVCLIGGLATYIIYSYLPNASFGAARLNQPAGAQQPSFGLTGGSAQVFSRGQSLRAQGSHFGANDSIQFSLDSAEPVLASNGSVLNAQTDSQGAFAVTIVIGNSWTVGSHIISASDARANMSASMDIEVNLNSTPVTSANNTDLAFTLNGQPLNQLSFTAQVGQPGPAAQRITFTNISGAVMQWSAVASTDHNLNWLNIVDSDFAGQLDISQPHTMGISINPADLAVTPKGTLPYSGQIVFTINGNTLLTMPVLLTIIDATPEMVFSPNPLVVTANANGTCQPGNTLTFINLGTTVINWSANPDLQNNIWFVNNTGQKTQQGTLLPSGSDGDTFVATLQCSGVKPGNSYTVLVFANGVKSTEIIQIE